MLSKCTISFSGDNTGIARSLIPKQQKQAPLFSASQATSQRICLGHEAISKFSLDVAFHVVIISYLSLDFLLAALNELYFIGYGKDA